MVGDDGDSCLLNMNQAGMMETESTHAVVTNCLFVTIFLCLRLSLHAHAPTHTHAHRLETRGGLDRATGYGRCIRVD